MRWWFHFGKALLRWPFEMDAVGRPKDRPQSVREISHQSGAAISSDRSKSVFFPKPITTKQVPCAAVLFALEEAEGLSLMAGGDVIQTERPIVRQHLFPQR